MRPLVVVESPYQGGSPEATAENVAYAKRCVVDCLRREEYPYASHLFFTQDGLLDDLDPEQRKLGIEAGLAWGVKADLVAFYADRGVSKGMMLGFDAAMQRGARIEIRALDCALPPELRSTKENLDGATLHTLVGRWLAEQETER